MVKKTIAYVMILVAVGIGIYWYSSGANIYTLTSVPVEVKDELFGTTETHWEETYRPGLDVLGPAMGGLILIASVLLWLARRDGRRPQPE
ncbi:MAG: hypothetical protein IPM61_04685 [Chlorobi bacterium]|nr:MAG: hypothetical protein UZ07_CHB004000777 [Chlorobi bacterium OLB7]MBK8910607.1 hypothetical protein [Chlorobiota bacterium]MBX7216180.1 hypothetical protein [Candidatus Kapabacteria bacterium]